MGNSTGFNFRTPSMQVGNVADLPTAPGSITGTAGVWTDVTPGGLNLTTNIENSNNFGCEIIVANPLRQSDIYVHFDAQGIYKSTDYGVTWAHLQAGAELTCAGGVNLGPRLTAVPRLYQTGIRVNLVGYALSNDDGASWTTYNIAPLPSNRQDIYPISVDPWNPSHLIATGHEQNYIVESRDSGLTWSNVTMDAGMSQASGTGFVFFINTGVASTTANTWLWTGQTSIGAGTWRTSNGGTTWAQVDLNEHPHGAMQIWQPDPGQTGIIFTCGQTSALGKGVLRSTDYGVTWAHVGNTVDTAVVWGTPANIYSMYGWSTGVGNTVTPNFQTAPMPGTGSWTNTSTPAGMTQGPHSVAAVTDGAKYAFLAACGTAGVWRYVES